MSGNLIIVSAPSGAGKTSLIKALVESEPHVVLSVSHTTRASRPGERDGVDYHFVDIPTFESMQAEGAFLETARVFDNYYGTSQAAVEDELHAGRDVVLEIDWQGARQIRRALPQATSVFILPPSRQALEARLKGRGQDDDSVIERRMADAVSELGHYDEYDYLVVNDVFERALEDLRGLVHTQRLRRGVQVERHGSLLEALLSAAPGME